MDLRLQGKAALITGGSRGIGRAIAHSFAAEGADIAICARDESQLKLAVTDLQRHGTRVIGIVADVTHTGDTESFVGRAVGQLGGRGTGRLDQRRLDEDIRSQPVPRRARSPREHPTLQERRWRVDYNHFFDLRVETRPFASPVWGNESIGDIPGRCIGLGARRDRRTSQHSLSRIHSIRRGRLGTI